MGNWFAEYKEVLLAIGGLLQLVLWPLLVRWAKLEIKSFRSEADEKFEPKHKPRTEIEQQLHVDSLGRQILSSKVLEEFATNTKSDAINGDHFWKRVEHITCESMTIQDKMDRRAKHAVNNFETEIGARFSKLHEEMRTRVSDSQAILVSEIQKLSASVTGAVSSLDKKLDIHIAVEEARAEALAKK